jgi:hypothetical protein
MPDHFSYSQLATFLRCGEQYRRRYGCGEKIPPGVAAIRGVGCHVARGHNMRQKMATGSDLPGSEIADVARDAVKAAFAGDVWFAPDEKNVGKRKLRDKTIDAAVGLARLDRERLHPAINPVFVEADKDAAGGLETGKIVISHPELPEPVWVFLDLVDGQGPNHQVIRDLKTRSKMPPEGEVERSTQLTIQHMAWLASQKSDPSSCPRPSVAVAFDYLVDAAEPKVKSALAERTQRDWTVALRRLTVVMTCIKRGDFPPCPEGSWFCAPKWCGYYQTCPYVAR